MFDDPVPLDETDSEVLEEMFETFQHLGWTADDIKDTKLKGPYKEWLKNH